MKKICRAIICSSLLICFSALAQAQVTPIADPPSDLLNSVSSQMPHFSKEMAQLALFSKKLGSKLYAEYHHKFRTPKYLTGQLSAPSASSPADIALKFVNQHRQALKIGANDKVVVHSWKDDDLGFAHVKMRFYQNGLEIWPAEALVHMDTEGVIQSFNGIFRSTPAVDTKAKISAKDALTRVMDTLDLPFELETESKLLIYDWHVETPVLAYKIHLHPKVPAPYGEEVFVNAQTGEIINRINKVCAAIPGEIHMPETWEGPTSWPTLKPNLQGKTPVNVTVFPTNQANVTAQVGAYNDGTGLFLINTAKRMFPGQLDSKTLAGTIFVLDAKHNNMPQGIAGDPNGDGVFNDNADAVAAGAIAYQMSRTYDWLLQTFNRDSFDGKGSALPTIANFRTDPNQGLDNAFWNGRALIFGDGGRFTTNWAFGLDFATHEICHAITSSTADLVYQFQSGALNEAFSDMYAATQDDANWLLGETITIASVFGAPALRSLANPSQGLQPNSNGWQPSNMSQYVNLQANVDNGGVHINSGIPNHAYYQLAQAIGRPQAIQIMHRALTMYLSRNSEFGDAKAAAERAAGDLYGANSSQKTAVSQAFAAVGIGQATTPPNTSSNTTLYYPLGVTFTQHGLSFTPSFYVASVSDQTVNGKATWYSNDGTETFTTPFTLNPHAATVGTFGQNDHWVKVEADGPVVGAFQEMTADGSAWALMPATPFIGNGMFIPHIATDNRFWTIASVANVRDTQSSVIYVDNLSNGYNVGVNQVNTGTAFDYEAVYGTLPDASAQGGLWGFFMNYDLTAQKVLEQNMVGAEMFGRKDVSQAAGLLMDATSGRNLLFTHVAANTDTFWTGYSIVNLDSNATAVNILAFDDKGSVLANSVKNLPGFGKILAVTGDSSLPRGTSWFTVLGLSETTTLAGMELFGTLNGQSITGFQVSPTVGTKLAFPFVISGTSNLPDQFNGLPEVFTGISIVNPSTTAANLTLRLYNNQGQIVTRTTQLAPGNKFLGTLSNIFGVSNFYGHVEISSDVAVSGFSLSGFLNGQELASNPAIFLE